MLVAMGQEGRNRLAVAAETIRRQNPARPLLGMVLGSGLGAVESQIESAVRISYADIPGMPVPTVPGHRAVLSMGRFGQCPVACLSGRVHLYEGHEPETVVFGVRLLAELGCRAVILTNAAGSLDPELVTGNLLLISDHVNLTGRNPLLGWNNPARFLDMSDAYDPWLRRLGQDAAAALGITVSEGVYAGLLGPSYETPAEVRWLRSLGARVVGMSTVLETLALRDLGVRVGAVCCVTNAAAGVKGAILDHDHVQQSARAVQQVLAHFLGAWLERITAADRNGPEWI